MTLPSPEEFVCPKCKSINCVKELLAQPDGSISVRFIMCDECGEGRDRVYMGRPSVLPHDARWSYNLEGGMFISPTGTAFRCRTPEDYVREFNYAFGEGVRTGFHIREQQDGKEGALR